MVTPLSLQDALNDFLKDKVAAKFKFKSINSSNEVSIVNPRIIRSGWVLPGSVDDDDESEEVFPYIVTRIDKVEHIGNARAGIVTVMILFGIYAPAEYDAEGKAIDDGSGYRDFWNIIESTRQALFEQAIIDNKYRIVDDFFEAQMIDDQVFPYWEGYCLTKWHIVFPYPDSYYRKELK